MLKKHKLVDATQAQLDELLVLAKPTFPAEQCELLQGVLTTFSYVMRALQNAKTSLKRFRQMLFGAKTESKDKVLAGTPGTGVGVEALQESGAIAPSAKPADKPATPEPKGRAGHGRNGASAYCDSPVLDIAVPLLKSGDPCPQCVAGKVYESPPKVMVRVVGQSPLGASVIYLEQLRCRICEAVFSAPMPDGQSTAPKYDPSCAAMLALLRYGAGMPLFTGSKVCRPA